MGNLSMRALAVLGMLAVTTVNEARGTSLLANVPEAGSYTLVYEFPVPVNSPGWNTVPVAYSIDNHALIGNGAFSRVAYYLELAGQTTDWVYVSMDAFTGDAGKIGLPNVSSGEFYHYGVGGNMPAGWDGHADANIFSNVPGVVTGTGIGTVNLEFWPSNYGQSNDYGVPGGNGGAFDFADGGAGTSAGHGAMQIHNYGAQQTLFAYNAWGAARTSELGIGNQPGGAGTNTDWTFNTANIGRYDIRTLQILVLTAVPEPSTVLVLGLGGLLLRRRVNRD